MHLCLLEAASLDILAGDDGVEVDGAILAGAYLGFGVGVELPALEDVEVDGVGPGDHEESQGNNHGALSANAVGDVSEDDWNDGSSTDGRNKERSTALGVATETTEGQSEDDGEDARLEEEHNHEEGKATPVGGSSAASVDTDGGSKEDHDGGLVDEQDNAGLKTDVHEARSGETTNGEEGLGDSVVVGTLVVSLGDIELGVRLGEEVDEERGDTDLSTNVAELSGNTEEESVLAAERLVDVSSSRGHHLGLISHVGVGDLRDGSEVENNSQDTDEDGDTKVNPLDGLERLAVLTDILEDNEGSKNGSNDGADSLERLRKLETELSPLRRTADSNVGVGRGLESRQTGADNEHGTAETTEASLDSRRPEHESSDAVDAETEHEGVAVAKLAQEPSRVCEGADEVGTEVGGLETR